MTYDGNRPFTRAMYSFRTVPAMNSSVSSLAPSIVKGIIIRPEVNRSNLLTAVRQSNVKMGVEDKVFLRTVNLIIAKLLN